MICRSDKDRRDASDGATSGRLLETCDFKGHLYPFSFILYPSFIT